MVVQYVLILRECLEEELCTFVLLSLESQLRAEVLEWSTMILRDALGRVVPRCLHFVCRGWRCATLGPKMPAPNLAGGGGVVHWLYPHKRCD